MADYIVYPHYDFIGSKYEANVELIGFYKDCKNWRGYDLGDRKIVVINPKVIQEEEKIFDFINSYDVSIGDKIEIEGQEYTVTDKKYQLDGVIDYYIKDRFIKCENYEELYEKVKNETKTYLEGKRELEVECQNQRLETEIDKKKSIWWYFGIR